jgi:hypothetical protein
VNFDGVEAVGNTTGFALAGGNGFFGTATGGDAASPSAIGLKATGRKNGRVRTTGKLTPTVAGAQVAIAARESGSGAWRVVRATTDSQGRYSVTWEVDKRTSFVAQWAGSQRLNSAGSKVRKAEPKE